METFSEAVARARALAVRRYTVWIVVWVGAMTYLALSVALGTGTALRLAPVLGLHVAMILTAVALRGPLKRGKRLGFCIGLSAYVAITQLGGGVVSLFAKVDHPWAWTVSLAVGLNGVAALRALLAVIAFRRALARDDTALAETFS